MVSSVEKQTNRLQRSSEVYYVLYFVFRQLYCYPLGMVTHGHVGLFKFQVIKIKSSSSVCTGHMSSFQKPYVATLFASTCMKWYVHHHQNAGWF